MTTTCTDLALRPVCPANPRHGRCELRAPGTYEQWFVFAASYVCPARDCRSSVHYLSLEFVEWAEAAGWPAARLAELRAALPANPVHRPPWRRP